MMPETLPQTEGLRRSNMETMERALGQVWEIARDFGMDPTPANFELVPPAIMHELASYGLPDRFSHWSHGRTHRYYKTTYEHGLARLYEMVVNSDPSQAFLLETNDAIDNILVMAHVLGHTEFSKHNYLFKPTRKDMPRIAHLHGERIQEYAEKNGAMEVEQFLDAILAFEWNIDPSKPDRLTADAQMKLWVEQFELEQNNEGPRLNEYDVLFTKRAYSPPKEEEKPKMRVPFEPDRDILGFIRDFSPVLTDWQRDIIDIVRNESLYFYPQTRTKIMNEGWASFWHKTILNEMRRRGYLTEKEQLAWPRTHSGIVRPDPTKIQPYFVGMKMYEYIMDHYNGSLTDEENSWLRSEHLPVYPKFEGEMKDSPGLKKIREVMREDNDQSFFRNYFDRNIATRLNMYVFETVEHDNETLKVIADRSWELVRDMIVDSLDNGGQPHIVVEDMDANGRGELLLRHIYGDEELEVGYTEKTLPHLYALWGKPVHLETPFMGDMVRFTYDGYKVNYSSA